MKQYWIVCKDCKKNPKGNVSFKIFGNCFIDKHLLKLAVILELPK